MLLTLEGTAQLNIKEYMFPFLDSVLSVPLKNKVIREYCGEVYVFTGNKILFDFTQGCSEINSLDVFFDFTAVGINSRFDTKEFKKKRKRLPKSYIDLSEFFYLVNLRINRITECGIVVSVTIGPARIPNYEYAFPQVVYVDFQYEVTLLATKDGFVLENINRF